MPNVKQAELEALRNLLSQAHLIVSTEPVIAGGIERARQLLAAAEQLADFLLTDSSQTNKRRKPLKSARLATVLRFVVRQSEPRFGAFIPRGS